MFLFSQPAAVLPLAIVHTMANLFTNMSPGKVAVSFTRRQGSQGAEAYLTCSPSYLPRSGDFILCATYTFSFCLLPLMNIPINLQLLIPLVVLCLVPIATFQSRNVMRVTRLPIFNFFQ
jgi:hypothetical protein